MPYLPVFVLYEANKQPDVLVKKMFGAKKPPVHLFAKQVEEEIKKRIIKPIDPLQLFLNMLSMCIFPFMAKPMFEQVVGLSKRQFDAMIEERKKLVPAFIIASIKK